MGGQLPDASTLMDFIDIYKFHGRYNRVYITLYVLPMAMYGISNPFHKIYMAFYGGLAFLLLIF